MDGIHAVGLYGAILTFTREDPLIKVGLVEGYAQKLVVESLS